MLPFYCCWCCYYTTARLNAAQIFAVGVGVMLPILLQLEPPFHLGEVKCCPNFNRWCRRYAAHFTAVGAALYTTVRVNAAQIFVVGVGVMLPILLLFEPPFYTTVRLNAA